MKNGLVLIVQIALMNWVRELPLKDMRDKMSHGLSESLTTKVWIFFFVSVGFVFGLIVGFILGYYKIGI
jgi:hypothetical protein